ncbi:MAG: aminopeptidase N [Kineosporiaceae bacterium]
MVGSSSRRPTTPPPGVLTQDEARRRRKVIPSADYDVELDLRDAGDTFGALTTIRFPAEPGARTFVDLRARRVLRAELNGRPLAVDGEDGRLFLPDLLPDNKLVVHAECGYSRSGAGLHAFVDPVDAARYVYTHFQPFDAHRVYPCFDQPDIKARVAWTVHAPPDWTVLGNAPGVGDGGIWRLARTPPIPTYVTAIAAGPLHSVSDRHRGVPLGLHCRRSLAADLDHDELVDLTRRGLDFFSDLFDRPYPFPSYHQVFVPEFAMGGMENVGCVTLEERYLFGSVVTDAKRLSRANVLLHEMCHMWLGNLVTMRWWGDLWLSEAFATYLASLALSRATRFGERAWAEFAHVYEAWAHEEDRRPTNHPVVADVPDTAALATLFDGITYAKGAAVLKQLVHWVGPEAFRDGLRRFVAGHAFGNADLSDLVGTLDATSAGGGGLAEWLTDWVTTTGVGVVRPELQVGPDGRYSAAAIRQDADDGPSDRRHRVAVGLYARVGLDTAGALGGELIRRDRFDVLVSGPRTEVPALVGIPAADLVLVNDDDLAYTRVRFDPRSTATLLEWIGGVRSPLARTLCWGALWDMTRDAELPASRWVATVCRHSHGEDDVGVLQGLLGWAGTARHQYTAPGAVADAGDLLARSAGAALGAAGTGGDAQLVWTRCLVTHAADPTFARGLLDGSRCPGGVVVDAALRWHAVARLAVLGALDGQAIDAEQRRDPGELGRRRAWTARAGLPDRAAKAAAFTAAVTGVADGHRLSLAARRAVLAGFWRPEQTDLLADYAAGDWVEGLARVLADEGAGAAGALVGGLFPACRATPSVVAAADRVLAGRWPPGVLRIVAEARDDTVRALRAQAADSAPGRAGERRETT